MSQGLDLGGFDSNAADADDAFDDDGAEESADGGCWEIRGLPLVAGKELLDRFLEDL